jgi:hypothetical protein
MAPTGINRPGYSSSPTGINRPGYSSPKPPTGVNRPGTSSPSFSGYSRPDRDNDGPNIVVKPKPPVPTFKQPPGQSVFAPTTSSFARKQYYDRLGGGPAPLQDILNITQRYNRAADIPGYQAKMRDYEAFQQAQANDGIARFSQGPLAGQQILSMNEPQLTAMAPTFKQLMGDVGGAFGSMAQGLAEKGTPMMNLAKSLFGGVQNFFGNQMDNAQGFFADQMASRNQFNQQLLSLTPPQRMVYDRLITQPGMTRERAYSSAIQSGMASGGIATLH